jgi:NAD(P)-dependent dehydrogenase (short-subunit alcohol dehydrogenase family)
MGNRMQDKIVIVTGAASGLGKATVELMVAEGATVIAADVNAEAGAPVAAAAGAEFVQTDVADSAAVDSLVGGVVERYGRLDVMVNNAGVFGGSNLIDAPNEEVDRMVGVNILGAFYGTRAAGRVMAAQGSGAIVNTASNGGSLPTEGMAFYSGSKAAVIGMSKACAIELAPKGVRVNTLSPGTMLSGMVPPDPEFIKVLHGIQPIGYAANPAQMATGILYLASDEANYVTGHDLVVDGGATAGRPAIKGAK